VGWVLGETNTKDIKDHQVVLAVIDVLALARRQP
jgi:hypothetical protein